MKTSWMDRFMNEHIRVPSLPHVIATRHEVLRHVQACGQTGEYARHLAAHPPALDAELTENRRCWKRCG